MRAFALLVAAAAVGCGGGDDDFTPPTCAAGEVVIEGTVDGATHEAALSGAGSYVFVNALGDDPGQLTVGAGDSEMLSLTWPTLVANGASVDARGRVAAGELDYGNCDDDGFPGTLRMDAGGGGGSFRLTALRPAGDCASAEVDGELIGCFRSPN